MIKTEIKIDYLNATSKLMLVVITKLYYNQNIPVNWKCG